jgi:hypothetical protein
MTEGVLGGGRGAGLWIQMQERTAGGREDQAPDVAFPSRVEALEERAVLAVHRDQSAAMPFESGADERAADDEAFLVRKRDGASAGQGGQRGREAGGSDDGVDDDVNVLERG